MELFNSFKDSVYSPRFYAGVIKKPLFFSIKYFYSLVLALSLALTVISSFSLVPKVHSFFRNLGPTILIHFPDDLVITIKKGEVSTNASEPYFLELPDSLRSSPRFIDKKIENLLVIDTKSESSKEIFDSYNTLVLLTRDTVIFRNNNSRLEIQDLKDVPDVVIDKKIISDLVKNIQSLSAWIIPLLVFGIFAFFVSAFTFKLVYLLFGALIVWIISKIKKIQMGYGKAYQVAIHAISLGMVLEFLLFALFPGAQFRFLFTILLFIIAWLNLDPLVLEEPAGERS